MYELISRMSVTIAELEDLLKAEKMANFEQGIMKLPIWGESNNANVGWFSPIILPGLGW